MTTHNYADEPPPSSRFAPALQLLPAGVEGLGKGAAMSEAQALEDDSVEPPTPGEDPIATLLRERFAAPDYRAPMLPAAAVEVPRLSQQADVGIDDIVLVLEKDTLLAGQVLKPAQSAFYAGKSPAKTLVHASVSSA
jgi:hypothetical protein